MKNNKGKINEILTVKKLSKLKGLKSIRIAPTSNYELTEPNINLEGLNEYINT